MLNATYPDKFRQNVENRIRERGIKLILGDYLDDLTVNDEGNVRTRKGETIKTELAVSFHFSLRDDIVLICGYQISARGPRPNTSFISSSLGSGVLTDNGYVKIKSTMQLTSNPHIFAAGDIIDFPEQKQVGKYYRHADIVAANVIALLENQRTMKEYKGPAFEGMFLTIGKVCYS